MSDFSGRRAAHGCAAFERELKASKKTPANSSICASVFDATDEKVLDGLFQGRLIIS